MSFRNLDPFDSSFKLWFLIDSGSIWALGALCCKGLGSGLQKSCGYAELELDPHFAKPYPILRPSKTNTEPPISEPYLNLPNPTFL